MTGPTGEVFRVDWLPGTDVLRGTCHCGAGHTAEDPIAMWEWMLAHPEGHGTPGDGTGGAEAAPGRTGGAATGSRRRGRTPRGEAS
ncbi:hypothetical protein [Streptomyces sp. NPDC002580]|uniref:hypothetical protein n=1 Tax=Streptomyces sp. NPDC002580 TaxID=3364653 RepID=UPI003686D569